MRPSIPVGRPALTRIGLSRFSWLCRRAAQAGGGRCIERSVGRDDHAIVAAGRLRRNEAESHVFRHCDGVALEWIAQTAAAGHRDDHALALRHRLLTFAAQLTSRCQCDRAGAAVLAAFAAARRMVDAVVIGTECERRRVEIGDLHDLAETAAKLARAAGVRPVFLAPDHDRRDRLVDLGRHVAHAARKCGRGEPVLAGTRAGAAGMEAHHIERHRVDDFLRIVGASRPAHGEQVPEARRALRGHRAAKRLMEAAEHDVRQHLPGDMAGGDRRRRLGVEDRAFRGGDADHRQRSFVVGNLRRHDAFHAERRIGLGVAERHVDAESGDPGRAGEVDVDAGLADGHRRHQIDRFVVAVDPHGELIGARLDLADGLERGLPGFLQDVAADAVEVVDPELVHHVAQATRADLVAGRERVEIADDLHRLAHTRADDVDQGLALGAGAREAHQRDIDALLQDVARVGGHAAAADIDHVTGAGEERHHLAAPEGRRDEGEVVQMAGALPRIVGEKDVAIGHCLDRELRQEVPDRARHRVDMAGRAGHRLREHGAVEVEHAGGEVASLAGRGGEAGANEGERLLLDHRNEAVPHQLHADRRQRIVGGHIGCH